MSERSSIVVALAVRGVFVLADMQVLGEDRSGKRLRAIGSEAAIMRQTGLPDIGPDLIAQEPLIDIRGFGGA